MGCIDGHEKAFVAGDYVKAGPSEEKPRSIGVWLGFARVERKKRCPFSRSNDSIKPERLFQYKSTSEIVNTTT